jgi:hypothetical protein
MEMNGQPHPFPVNKNSVSSLESCVLPNADLEAVEMEISPLVSSIYGLNLEKRLLDTILYEVDSSDIPRYLLSQIYRPSCKLVQK